VAGRARDLVVLLFLILPVIATIGTTFGESKGIFAPYTAFFGSGFRRNVLWRTLEISLATTAISLLVGFLTAYVVAKTPGRLKSLLIIAAVFPLLTGVVVRSFAWMIILGKNGILNNILIWLGITAEPFAMLYTEGAVIVAMVYLFVPLMILTLVGVLENIPEDVLQASASLGASPAATFRQVVFPSRRSRLDRRRGAGLHRFVHLLCHAATRWRRAANGDGHADVPARHGRLRLGRSVDDRRDHGSVDHNHRPDHEPHCAASEPDGNLMKTPLHPALIGFAILVYIFLVGPLIIVLGASVSDTTYLTFRHRACRYAGSRTFSRSALSAIRC
jgi:ABC-type Fe3+ transport system permease subunit